MAKSDDEAMWEWVGRFAVGVALLPVQVFTAAFVTHSMWEWFVTPAFSLPVPPYWLCYGLLLCYVVLQRNTRRYDDDPGMSHLKKSHAMFVIESVLTWWMMYGFGWIVKTYGPLVG